LALTTMDIVV